MKLVNVCVDSLQLFVITSRFGMKTSADANLEKI